MFSLKIVDTDEFLDMPPTTQNLYFHLCMRADDDGFVSNPKKIMKIINSANDDIRVLITKNFVIPFDSGVCVIKHWKIHNLIRKDRYTETEYKKEKKLLTEEDDKYKLGSGIPNGNQMATNGCRRLGKVRLGKDSNKNNSELKNSPLKRKDFKVKSEIYKRIIDAYEKYKGIKLSGAEYGEVKRAIKTMLYSKRTEQNIINFMKWVASILEEMEEDDKLAKKYCWLENWTILTIKRKMPEFLAGKLEQTEEVDIPSYAKGWK